QNARGAWSRSARGRALCGWAVAAPGPPNDSAVRSWAAGQYGGLSVRAEAGLLSLQFICQPLVQRAVAVGIGEAEQAHRAMALVGPAGVIHHRIEADALHRHALLHRQPDLLAHIVQPVATHIPFGPGFGDQQRAPVPVVDLREDAAEWPIVRVATLDWRPVQVPLVIRVRVDADDIQIFRAAAEARPEGAAQHVPGLELGPAEVLGLAHRPRPTAGRHHMNRRIHLHEAGARVDLADRVHGGNGGAHQLMLELEAAAPCHRVEVGNVAARPGPEGYLVQRRVERHPVALILDQLRHRSGVAGEMLDEGRAPDIDVIRPAVMAQIPDAAGRPRWESAPRRTVR